MTANVAVVGSYGAGLTMQIDKMPEAGETLHAKSFDSGHGGKGSNQAVGAARLGAATSLLTAVGDDAYGHSAKALWENEGIDSSKVVTTEEPTMVGFILVEPNGENRIAIAPGALSCLDEASIETFKSSIEAADMLIVSMEIPLAAVTAAIDFAFASETPVLLNPAPAQPLPPELLRKVSVITPNQSEARILLGIDTQESGDESEIAQRIFNATGGSVVMTRGAQGAIVVDENGLTEIPAVTPEAVVDTTGAGDAFTAALAVSLAEGSPILDAARFAAAAGSHAVTRPGVIDGLPSRKSLASTLEGDSE